MGTMTMDVYDNGCLHDNGCLESLLSLWYTKLQVDTYSDKDFSLFVCVCIWRETELPNSVCIEFVNAIFIEFADAVFCRVVIRTHFVRAYFVRTHFVRTYFVPKTALLMFHIIHVRVIYVYVCTCAK